jgi:Tol biopolymer transport system component
MAIGHRTVIVHALKAAAALLVAGSLPAQEPPRELPVQRVPAVGEAAEFYFSPDGKSLVGNAKMEGDSAQAPRGMPMTIFTIRHDGTRRRQVTTEPGTNWSPHPAPDGRHFVYVRMLPPHNFEIFLRDLETAEVRRLTFFDGFDGFPVLSPDGQTLAFASSRDAKAGERKLYTYTMDVSSLGLAKKR